MNPSCMSSPPKTNQSLTSSTSPVYLFFYTFTATSLVQLKLFSLFFYCFLRWSHYAVHVGLELVMLLLQPPEY
jgi:hypothetical protein